MINQLKSQIDLLKTYDHYNSLEAVCGLECNPIKVASALIEKDVDFVATMADGEEAGYRIRHKGCGGLLTITGICLNCATSVLRKGLTPIF